MVVHRHRDEEPLSTACSATAPGTDPVGDLASFRVRVPARHRGLGTAVHRSTVPAKDSLQ